MVTGPDGKEVKNSGICWQLLAQSQMSSNKLMSEILSFDVQGDECCQFDCTEDSLWTVRNLGVDGWDASELV